MNKPVFDTIEVRADLEADNDKNAVIVRDHTLGQGVCLINLMASPGAGKTTLLCRLIDFLSDKYRVGVMEADMDADVDSCTVAAHGADVVQLHTGTSCHMDAKMTLKGLQSFKNLPEVVFLENVGNLVCPAEFDVGADLKMMILSLPEGDDKPLKYPLMFTVSDLLVINKIDTAPVFDFDFKRCEQNVRALNPNMAIYPVSAKTGEGIDVLAQTIEQKISSVLAEKRKGASV